MPQGQPMSETPRIFFMFIMLMMFWIFNTPDADTIGPNVPFPLDAGPTKLERQKSSLAVLNQTKWGDFAPHAEELSTSTYVNLTGFRKSDGYAWGLLDEAKQLARLESERIEQYIGDEGATGFYHNITGVVEGRWVRHSVPAKLETRFGGMNLSNIAPNVFWARNGWDKNITGDEGKLMLRLDEGYDKSLQPEHLERHFDGHFGQSDIRSVSATMTIQDENSAGDGWEIRMHGLHWPHTGELVLTTSSHKFAGVFGLPHLMTTESAYEDAKTLLNRTLWRSIRKQEASWRVPEVPWQSDDKIPSPHCEFVTYAQAHLIHQWDFHGLQLQQPDSKLNTSSQLAAIEEELRFPSGAPILDAPPLRLSSVILSPDCGFILKSKGPPDYSPQEANHLQGLKREVWMKHIKHWSLVWAVVIGAQVALLRAQMKDSCTPSTLSRVSFYTIGLMVFFDTAVFATGLFAALTIMEIYPAPTIVGLIGLLSVGTGVRFVAEIFSVQEPERREQERVRAAAQVRISPPRTATSDTLPLPVTANPLPPVNDTPIIIPSDQDIDAEIAENAASAVPTNPTLTTTNTRTDVRADFATTYGHSVLFLVCIFLISLSSFGWMPIWRTYYVNTMSFLYLSFWLPQIYRNVTRNCRKALLWKFVFGQSFLRILPFAYFYLREDNILFAKTDWKWMTVLAGWVWIQIWALIAQDVLGPRFGLPKSWTPDAWEYHPVLREDDVEGGGLPIGLVQTSSSDKKSDNSGGATSHSHMRSVDCAICMQVLEVPTIPAGQRSVDATAGVAGMLARRAYMVTPCRHIFHTKCLEGWMRFRLACPICRESLPPL